MEAKLLESVLFGFSEFHVSNLFELLHFAGYEGFKFFFEFRHILHNFLDIHDSSLSTRISSMETPWIQRIHIRLLEYNQLYILYIFDHLLHYATKHTQTWIC